MAVYSTLDQLLALKIPEVQRIFLEVMQGIVDQALLKEMIEAIEANDAEKLFRASGFSPAALGPIMDAIEQIYKDSAQTTVAGWPRTIQTPTGRVVFNFDMRNPRVEEDLRRESSALITRLTNEARENVRMILEEGVLKGKNPRQTALNIVGKIDPVTQKRVGGVIGLTNNQTRWVSNIIRYLEELDNNYFTLKLRDKRFDKLVRNAIDSGQKISSSDIDRIVTRYKNNALKYRAETIARTESVQSLNRGEYMANKQVVDEGLLPSSAVKKEWDDTGDGRVRLSHRALASKYGKGNGIGIDEPFVTPSGARLMFPGDTTLGASADDVVNCRCRTRYRANFLDRGE